MNIKQTFVPRLNKRKQPRHSLSKTKTNSYINEFHVKGNVTIKNINKYNIGNVTLGEENIISQLRSEFAQIANKGKEGKKYIMTTSFNSDDDETNTTTYPQMFSTINNSIIFSPPSKNTNAFCSKQDTLFNTIRNDYYNMNNCINKQISFSIKSDKHNMKTIVSNVSNNNCNSSNSNKDIAVLVNKIKKLERINHMLLNVIKTQQNVFYNEIYLRLNDFKRNNDCKWKLNIQEKLNNHLLNENIQLRTIIKQFIEKIIQYEKDNQNISNKFHQITSQMLLECNMLRKICHTNPLPSNNINSNCKQLSNTGTSLSTYFEKFDVLKEATINKKQQHFKEIEEEIRMIGQGELDDEIYD